jgi:hypothetical protein
MLILMLIRGIHNGETSKATWQLGFVKHAIRPDSLYSQYPMLLKYPKSWLPDSLPHELRYYFWLILIFLEESVQDFAYVSKADSHMPVSRI